MMFLERNLEQLTVVQRQLVEQNSSLKKEVAIAERKLIARNERIQSLESLLQDSQEKLTAANHRYVGISPTLLHWGQLHHPFPSTPETTSNSGYESPTPTLQQFRSSPLLFSVTSPSRSQPQSLSPSPSPSSGHRRHRPASSIPIPTSSPNSPIRTPNNTYVSRIFPPKPFPSPSPILSTSLPWNQTVYTTTILTHPTDSKLNSRP